MGSRRSRNAWAVLTVALAVSVSLGALAFAGPHRLAARAPVTALQRLGSKAERPVTSSQAAVAADPTARIVATLRAQYAKHAATPLTDAQSSVGLVKETPSAGTDAKAQPSTVDNGAKGSYASIEYLVGLDIPAGRYKGTVTGRFPYWKVSSDEDGQDILSNDIPTGHFYFTVKDGQYLTLHDITIVNAESWAPVSGRNSGYWGSGYGKTTLSAYGTGPYANITTATPPADGRYYTGLYLVGANIPAGTYRGVIIGPNPYWELSWGHPPGHMVSCDTPTNPTESFHIQAQEGQSLWIQDVYIVAAPG